MYDFLDVDAFGGDRGDEWVVVEDQVFDRGYWYWSDSVYFTGFAALGVSTKQGVVVYADDHFGVVAAWWFEAVG